LNIALKRLSIKGSLFNIVFVKHFMIAANTIKFMSIETSFIKKPYHPSVKPFTFST